MTSRERVWKAINHEEPDVVPIDIGGTEATALHVDLFCEIGKRLGIDTEFPKVIDVFEMRCRMDEPVRSWLHTDVVQIENFTGSFGLKNEHWKPWTNPAGNRILMPGAFDPVTDDKGNMYLYDKNGKICAHMPAGGQYFDRYTDPNYETPDDLMTPEEWMQQIPLLDDRELRILENTAKYFYENTEYSLVGGYGKMKVLTTGLFAGQNMTDWMCTLITDPDYAVEILQATAERHIENLKLYLQALEPYIDVVLVSTSDYGNQRAEQFSPQIFKDVYAPAIKKVNDFIHANSHCKTLYHSCGSIRGIIGHMIDAGVDCLNPIQTNAANMDPVELKSAFGEKLTFWGGGVESQTVFAYGTPEDVENQVKERLEIFGRGGGYVFSPIHNTQSDVPFENVCAMRNALLKYRHY